MQNNPFEMIMSIMSGGNPQQFIKNEMMKNSGLGNTLTQLQNCAKANNIESKEFVLQWCKQNGIPENQVMQIAQKMGLK